MATNTTPNVVPSRAENRNTWNVPYYIRGLALGVPIYLAAIHLWTWALYVPDALRKGGLDFRQSYSAAYMLRTGHGGELYDYDAQKRFQDQLVSPQNIPLPFVEPAYEAVLIEPLTHFSFRVAYFLLLIVNVGLLCVCFVLLKPWMANLRAVYWWLPIVMFIGFLPIAVALIQGQDSILLLTAFVASFFLLVRQRQFLAGLALGLAIFKFQIVLPVAFLFLIWRHWRFVLGCTTSAVMSLGMGFLGNGLSQTYRYFSLILSLAGLKQPMPGFESYPVYWNGMACIHGIVFVLGHGWVSRPMLGMVTVGLSAIVLGWAATRGARIKSPSAQFLMATLCSVLVGHHVNIYDLSVLLIATFVVLDTFIAKEQSGSILERAIALIAALMFAAPVGMSFFPSHFSLVAFLEGGFLTAISLVASEGFDPEQNQRLA